MMTLVTFGGMTPPGRYFDVYRMRHFYAARFYEYSRELLPFRFLRSS